MASAPPELIDDAVGEILLRLPPEDPACLVRASLVCKSWRYTLSNPAFHRRYREFHRTTPPLLGFLCSHFNTKADLITQFVPATTSPHTPFLQPPLACYGYQPLDCRHGRVLLDSVGARKKSSLVVWDPLTGGHVQLTQPKGSTLPCSGVVLCAVPGCDDHHHDCHGGPFRVVFVASVGNVARAWVYSSEAAVWSAPASVDLGEHAVHTFVDTVDLVEHTVHNFVDRKCGAIVGDGIYFLLSGAAAILKFDLGKHCLSLIGSPDVYDSKPVALMSMEDGSLGLAGVKRGLTLHLWSRKVNNPKGVANWVQYKVIMLEKLFPTYKSYHRLNVISFAEGVGVLLVAADVSAFILELKSGRVKKVSMPRWSNDAIPFTGFYIPGT